MKKILSLFLCSGLFFSNLCLFPAQEKQEDLMKEIRAEMIKRNVPFYDPGGRRDPFRDLLGGKDVKETAWVEGVPQLSIDELNLVGIVKARNKFTAILSSPEGFPYFVKEGDQFSDGYILSIKETFVTFRKTKEKDVPLVRPKDIIKEIYPQER